jgi:hypothetical protein
MRWGNIFGSREPEQIRLVEAHDEIFDEARGRVLDRIETTVVDHNGRRLNERRWRDYRDFVRSL